MELTSGVRSGGFFFSACRARGSTGEFMAAAAVSSPPDDAFALGGAIAPPPASPGPRASRSSKQALRNARPGPQPTRDWSDGSPRGGGGRRSTHARQARARRGTPEGAWLLGDASAGAGP